MSDPRADAESPVSPQRPSSWLFMLRRGEATLEERLRAIYGTDEQRIEDRRQILIRLLDEFLRRHSDSRPVWIVRAPGRLTTLAMHVDHRGGHLNALCLQQEVLLVCRHRKDDAILIHSLQEDFGPRRFNISEVAPEHGLSDTQAWLNWTSRLAAERDQHGKRRDWLYKVAAPAAYLQHRYVPGQEIQGIEAVVFGDVPIGSGLSSSSAIVVACMEALLAVNEIDIPLDQFAHHCGMAEWFVGTRGGGGDHAAIKYGRAGHLTHMRTEPELRMGGHLKFPSSHRFVVFNSGIVADKTGSAGQRFNEMTATCAIGDMYMRRCVAANHPSLFQTLWDQREGHPVDKRIMAGDLVEAIDDDGLYDLLDEIPEQQTRAELRREWPNERSLLDGYFQTHYEPEAYRVRAVVAYGLAACGRARRAREILAVGDVDTFGEWMNVSHDADRVVGITDQIAARKRADDRSVPLHLQSGDYHCRIPEIDHMVDMARAAGAVGAQIAAAGLGGSMTSLVPVEAQQQVVDALVQGYKTPTGQPPSYFVAEPCTGSCLF